AATDLVHAVEGGVCPAVPVAGGDATRGAEEPRARDYPRVDGVADLNVEKALLRHHPHRGGAGGEVPAEIGRCPERLGHGSLTELADLVPGAGHDGDMTVGVDEAGHDEAVAEVQRLGPGGDARGGGGPGGGDAAVLDE